MSDTKISQLNSSATPLSGRELIVMNQNGVTVTSSLSDIKVYTNTGISGGSTNPALTATSLTLSGGAIFQKGTSGTSFSINAVTSGPISGFNSVFIGNHPGDNNGGDLSVCIGERAGSSNTGSYVHAIGQTAGQSNSGTQIVAIGYNAAKSNTGDDVNAIGRSAGWFNTGYNVIAIGKETGTFNSGDNVNAIGLGAAGSNTGEYVNAFGNLAGSNNTASNVITIGTGAGFANSGNSLIAIGNGSADNNSGEKNIFIGRGTSTSPQSLSGCIVIGDAAVAVASNQLVIGSTEVPLLTSNTGTSTGKYLTLRLNGQTLKVLLYS